MISYLVALIRSPTFLVPPCLGFLLAVSYALLVEDEFTASALLAPVEQDSSASALAQIASRLGSGFGGLVAGGVLGEADQRNLHVMRSRQVGELFVTEADLLPHLFPERWDAAREQWLPKRAKFFGLLAPVDPHAPPSMWFAYKRLQAHRTIRSDELSGTIRVSHTFPDAELAKEVTARFIDFVDEYIRDADRERVEENLAFLRDRLADSANAGMVEALSAVAEDQLRRRMFVEARPDYAFDVLDSPVVPGERSRPKTILALIIGVTGGTLLGVFLTLLLDTFRPHESSATRVSSA